GPKYGSEIGGVRSALGNADPSAIAAAVRTGQEVAVDGYRLSPDDVIVEAKEREGFAVAQEAGYTAIVTTEVTPELAAEGLAREVVHRVQSMRRDAGFDIADRIELRYESDDEVASVLDRWNDYVRQETLAERVARGEATGEGHTETQKIDG